MVGSAEVAAMRKRVVVVLGMHRSGTSAIAHALETMGVDLGGHLMPPAAGNNEKGFFEDLEINAINIDLLKALGDDWNSLAPISASALHSEALAPLRLRAISVLRSRLLDTEVFGFKDPRTCRLLPFWQHVFSHLQLDDAYVIALRHPISVAHSLEQRDKLAPGKSYFLWLLHMLPSVSLTQGKPRLVVDYDLLVDQPAAEVRRIAEALGLQDRLSREALSDFTKQFLEKGLRHAVFEPEDSAADPRVPAPVRQLFAALSEVARQRNSLDAPGMLALVREMAAGIDGVADVFGFVGQHEHEIAQLRGTVHDKQVHIENIERGYREVSQHLGARDAKLAELRKQVHDKDVHIGNIERGYQEVAANLGARDADLAQLRKQLHDREVQVASLDAAMVRQAEELAGRHEKELHEVERRRASAAAEARRTREQLAEAEAAVERGREQLAEARAEAQRLERDAQQKEVHIANLGVHMDNLRASLERLQVQSTLLNHRTTRQQATWGWKLGKPLRAVWGLAWRLGSSRAVDLIPLAQVTRKGDAWIADGAQPQFLLQTPRAWHGLAGWHVLQLPIVLPEAAMAAVQFDLASGASETLRFPVAAGLQQPLELPVYVPQDCTAVRLEPCDKPLRFELGDCSLKRLSKAPALTERAGVFERLGAREGNAADLVPVSGLNPLRDNDDYGWAASHADPYFQLARGNALKPGWYMVEVVIHASTDAGGAKLYFDYGSGYSEDDAVLLPFVSGVASKRLVYLRQTPLQVRFDPIERPARFSVTRLNFGPVWASFARDRMLRRLRKHVVDYRTLSRRALSAQLRAEAASLGKPFDEVLLARYGMTFNSYSGVMSYADWIETVERPSMPSAGEAQRLLADIEPKPLLSVIVPTYNTNAEHLRACLDSVLRQSYPKWELCIADDASPQPHVQEILREYEAKDPRIKVCLRTENGHISQASNSALELATGEFVVLLDHDDELAEHALLFVAEAIHRKPSVQILYSDEDKLDARGKRVDPHFKSGWNVDLFYAQNYVSHLGVYRRSLMASIGGFRPGVEGSQDQDLLLRCLPRVAEGDIVHIPRVLYHWRTVAGSTALDSGEKSYTADAGLRALRDYFDSQGKPDVQLEPAALPNSYRVRWPVPQPAPLVSLIIPTRDRRAITEVAVRSILEKTSYPDFEILIVDNGSVEAETLQFFTDIQREDARVRVIRYDQPFNFSAINNFAERNARGEILGLVNNDVEVINPEWLTEMVSHACRPEIGCVGAKLYYSNDTLQHAGVILGLGGVAGHSHKYAPRHSMGYYGRLQLVQSLSAVTAACLIVRRDVYLEVGGLDEKNLVVAFNDVDFCLKVRAAGYRNLWTPYAELYHHESISRGAEDTPEKLERFQAEVRYMTERWPDELALDPYYNPNLTSDREDFSY